ncbi:MAG: DUF4980 domain-containing protein [Prevotella sp.]|nr:DUF4980 domain-containing protein [Candidatus Prevotella equi]
MSMLTSVAQDLRIESLANENSLIRISPSAKEKYLLLPIEDNAPESKITIVADNQMVRSLNVRLALSKIDYYVPFELTEYRGKNLMLQTHVAVDHSNRGGVGSAICLRNIKLSNTFDNNNREKYRPEFHHTPLYGWMNDPNGMFYKDGQWHLYYQYNPYGSMWGNMHWAHSVSTDLINWEHKGTVLSPDANGTIFSGSCIVDKDNTAGFGKDAIIAMYTSCIQTPWGHDLQEQSIAYSLDNGNTFHVYEGNPVLTADIVDFRDPNMFWNEDIKAWNLIMSAGQEMRIYSSPNMKDWKEESRFGKEYGCHDGVWECPDLLKLKIANGKMKDQEKWVLICNINPGGPSGGSATQYFIGDFDGHKFTVDDESRYHGSSLWQDYGKDHYAAVSFSNAPDNRHTMIAWMSNWQYANNVPTMQYRSANSIAREPYIYYGADKKLYLGSRPSPEYTDKGLDKTVKVKGSCTVTLSNEEGEEFNVIYDQKAMTLTVDRAKSGETAFSQDFAVHAVAPVHNKLTSLRFFIDKSSVEVFGNDGEVVMTSLVFPKSKYNKINIK